MRGLHIIFQYSTTQPSTPSQPTIIIQRWICQKIYTETSPLMLLTTWLQRPTMMTTVFLASWQQKLTLTIFLHRTEAASSIIACLIHSSNLLQLNHFETHPSELQGDTNLFLAILIYKSTQGISNNSRVLNGFIPNQRQPPQPVAIDVSCYCSDACNDFSKKIMGGRHQRSLLFVFRQFDGSSRRSRYYLSFVSSSRRPPISLFFHNDE